MPDLAIRKEIAIGRAYDEYCLRIEAGETVDTVAFCNLHSEFRSALFRRIELHEYLDQNPDTLQYLEPIPWPKAGESFGDCTLIEELGYGGAGRVFLAKENELSRLIVLKLVAGDNGEADRLCRLKHRYIIPIYYVWQDQTSLLTAICMPFESRYTLNDFLDAAFRNQTIPNRFDEVMRQLFPSESNAACNENLELKETNFIDGILIVGHRLAEALNHSHRAGIYHLDLKPSNVLVKPDGTPLLIDFNLAVNADQNVEILGGTKPYMSPEQIQRLLFPFSSNAPSLDGQSDVFSLGVMLCQLLTGEHPFGSVSWNGTEQQLLLRQRDWSPAELNRFADIDGKIVHMLAECLAVDPDRRIKIAELAIRLERILRHRRGAWLGTRRRYFVISTIIVAGITAGIISTKDNRQPDPTRLFNDGVEQLKSGRYEEAISSFSRTIDVNPSNASAWSNRALAILQRGEGDFFARALSDYEEAHQRSLDPVLVACIGFCEANLDHHLNAVSHLDEAIADGFESAELFNVLGYCQMRLTYYDEAEVSFTRALGKNPQLQAALYNRAINEFQRSGNQQRQINRSAVTDIELVLKTGEVDPMDLYWAACIWDRLPSNYPNRTAKILEYLDRSLQLGIKPEMITAGPQFQGLRRNPAFRAILKRPRPDRRVANRPRLPHPLGSVISQLSDST